MLSLIGPLNTILVVLYVISTPMLILAFAYSFANRYLELALASIALFVVFTIFIFGVVL